MSGTLALLAAVAAGPLGADVRGRARAEVPALVTALGSPRYADRAAAGRRLHTFGVIALPAVRDAARASPDLEVRQRAAGVLDAIERTRFGRLRTFAADGLYLSALAVSPDGRQAVAGGLGGSLHVYDLWAGRRVRTVAAGRAAALAYHPDGRSLAFAGAGLATVDTATWAVEPLPDTQVAYENAAYSPDGRFLLAVGYHRAEWWDVAARKRRAGPMFNGMGVVWAAAVRPDGRRFAVAGQDYAVHVWATDPPAALRTTPVGPNVGYPFAAAFTPDGQHLVVGTQYGRLIQTDADTGAVRRSFDAHPGPVFRIVFEPGGRRAATAGHDGSVRLWDADTWELLHAYRGDGDVYMNGVAFAPNRPVLLAVGDKGRVYEWAVPRPGE